MDIQNSENQSNIEQSMSIAQQGLSIINNFQSGIVTYWGHLSTSPRYLVKSVLESRC